MGYETYFELTIESDQANNAFTEPLYERICSDISDISDYGFACYSNSICSNDCIKWYNHSEHMKQLSLKYPNLTFKLYGDGEESDDFWRAYYHNGKSVEYQAELICPQYNPKDLK